MSTAETTSADSSDAGPPNRLQRLDNLLESASDYINPILVKETRQALKSQQFVIWFLLLLVGCWVATIAGLAVIGPEAYYSAPGGQMFRWYAAMLAFPLLVVAPFSAFRSLASEQEDNTRDVLTVSALSPRQVINGKLGSATLQMIVYLSAIAPCLGFTYLLRGIDLFTLVYIPLLGILACVGLSLIGLLLASASTLRYVQVLLSVAFVGGLLLLFWASFDFVEEFTQRGYSYFRDPEFWMVQGMIASFCLTTGLLIYLATIALNTFTSANRSTPLRSALLLQQAVFIGWAAGLMRLTPEPGIPVGCFVIAVVYWTFAGMLLTGESRVLSERVRRSLPKHPVARMFFSWLTPGPGTGYCFVLANVTFCFAVAAVGLWYCPGSRVLPIMFATIIEIGCLMIAYIAAFLGLGRLVILALRRVANLSMLGGFLVHFLVMLAASGLPIVIRTSFVRLRQSGFSYIDLPSPFAMIAHLESGELIGVERFTALLLIGGFACCMLLVNLAMAAREIQQMRSPLPRRVVEDDQQLAPRPARQPTNPWGDLPREAPQGLDPAVDPAGG